MLRRSGRILWTRDSRAGIALQSLPGCEGCASGCALFSFGRAFGRPGGPVELDLPRSLQARPGDRIRISLPASSFLRAVLVGLGLPLVGLLIGGAGGRFLVPGGTDAVILAGSLCGLAAAFFFARRCTRPPALHIEVCEPRPGRDVSNHGL